MLLNQLFHVVFHVLFTGFHVLLHEKCHFSWKKNKKTGQYAVYTCTIYTYKLHQIPIKYNIYIGGIPSVLMKHQVIIRDLCWIRCFSCFSCAFHKKYQFSHKKHHFSWKQQNQVNMCVYKYHLNIHAPHTPPSTTKMYDILSWPSLCTLWKTRSKWDICVESAVFVVFQVLFSCFHELFMYFSWKVQLFIPKVPLFMKTNKTSSMCVYMYHLHIHAPHAPRKYKIYLVGLPSVLYERPSQNERSVLNQLFLLLFQVLFSVFHVLFMKSATFHEHKQNQVNVCAYMHSFTHTCTTKYHQNITYT